MAWQEIASGTILNATDIQRYEVLIEEHQRGLLELQLRAPAPGWAVEQLRTQLTGAGVKEVQVTTGSPLLRISWRKGFPWLVVIVGIVIGLIVLALLIVGWRLFKEIMSYTPSEFQPIVVLAMIAVGLYVVAQGARRFKWP